MALNLEAKKAVVEQVNAVANVAVSVGVAEYRGLNVGQMTNCEMLLWTQMFLCVLLKIRLQRGH